MYSKITFEITNNLRNSYCSFRMLFAVSHAYFRMQLYGFTAVFPNALFGPVFQKFVAYAGRVT